MRAEIARAIDGGLALHSIGSLYPLAIVGYGNGHDVEYGVENLQTGERLYHKLLGKPVRFPRAASAIEAAENCISATTKVGPGFVPNNCHWVRA